MSPQSQMIDRRESSVRKMLTALFEATDGAVENALLCIKDHDTNLAQTIIDGDTEINQLYRSTEEECVASLTAGRTLQKYAGHRMEGL
jgi:phosphate uptake regulator